MRLNPQLFYDALQRRGVNPPAINGPIEPQRQLNRAMQMLTPQKPGGLSGFLQKPGVADMLMSTGAALLAQSDQPGSLGGALGRAIPVGMQALRQGQQSAALDQVFATAPASMRQLLQGLDLPAKQQLALQMAQQGRPDPVALAQGSILVDPESGQRVAANPAAPPNAPAVLDVFREWMSMDEGERGNFEEFLNTYQPAPVPSAVVNLGTEEKGLTETELRMYDDTANAAIQAESTMDALATMERLLDSGMSSGGLTEATLPLRRLAAGVLGVVDVDTLAQQEVFKAMSDKLALANRSELPGQMSDRDIRFLQGMAPQLSNTPEGNRMMIAMLRRIAQRKIEIADLQDQYIADNGSLRGFRQYRSKWVQENPLFSDMRAPF